VGRENLVKDAYTLNTVFQSAPAFVGRENRIYGADKSALSVSIRSRLCGAGEPSSAWRSRASARFQSAPAFVGRENEKERDHYKNLVMFQSAPAFVGRENLLGPMQHREPKQFQSAPAFVGRENAAGTTMRAT